MNHIGMMAFSFVNRLLCHADVQKLGKLSELDKLKRKHQCFQALSNFVVDDPRSLVRSSCSWYKTWGCTAATQALSKYIPQVHSPTSLEYALVAMDTEFVIVMLRRI